MKEAANDPVFNQDNTWKPAKQDTTQDLDRWAMVGANVGPRVLPSDIKAAREGRDPKFRPIFHEWPYTRPVSTRQQMFDASFPKVVK